MWSPKSLGSSDVPGIHPSTVGTSERHLALLCARLYAYALRADIEAEHSSVPINTFAPGYWGTDGMVYISKQPWRVTERDELPLISNFYRTEAIFDDVEGLMVKCFEDKRDAFEFITRENAYPPRSHLISNAGDIMRVPLSTAVGTGSSLTQYANGWCAYACEGWHQHRHAVPATL